MLLAHFCWPTRCFKGAENFKINLERTLLLKCKELITNTKCVSSYPVSYITYVKKKKRKLRALVSALPVATR